MKTRTIGRLLATALTTMLLVAATTVTAMATDVTYLNPTVDSDGTVAFATATVTTFTYITENSTSLSEGWYMVGSDVTIASRIEVTGDVHLILADNATLNASKGITVEGTNSLTIYAQSEDRANMGKLVASAASVSGATGSNAGIGGTAFNSAGTITINGGNITATGGSGSGQFPGSGAGIGGGGAGSSLGSASAGSGGYITINGGNITATGGSASGTYPGSGAGIGGGGGGGYGSPGASGVITITGGTVTASGGDGGGVGAGIGNGNRQSTGISTSGSVTLSTTLGYVASGSAIEDEMAMVRGTGERFSAFPTAQYVQVQSYVANYQSPIYETENDPSSGIASWELVLVDGEFTEIGADSANPTTWNAGWYTAYGSVTLSQVTVSGDVSLILEDGADLTISQGITLETSANLTIYVQSWDDDMGKLVVASGITGEGTLTFYGGDTQVTGTISINTMNFYVGALTSSGGSNNEGIGTNTLTIYDGTIIATGIGSGAGIVAPTLTQYGGDITATGGDSGHGIAGNTITINGGTLTATGGTNGRGIYYDGTITINDGTITATGGDGGIYGGGTITIKDGSITATGGDGGHGITGNTITIKDGSITATGGDGGDGIYGNTITINNGSITATGGENGHGICGGTITITYGAVTAVGGDSGSGIVASTVTIAEALKYGTSTVALSAITSTIQSTGDTINDFPSDQYVIIGYNMVQYLGENDDIIFVFDTTAVTASITQWSNGWYVVTESTEISSRITVSGDVHLILADNATLTAEEGITVNEGNSLTIYVQSAIESTMGALVSTASGSNAGIGGLSENSAGTITINGGIITAAGGTMTNGSGVTGAGIGGGNEGEGGTITINGGYVTATGGKTTGNPSATGAGIGGGGSYASDADIAGNGGIITINGGTVIANGGTATGVSSATGAGIGGGGSGGVSWVDFSAGAGGVITINGGTITATGGETLTTSFGTGAGAGIGGGGSYEGTAGSGGTITIQGGIITAIGGQVLHERSGAGAGIGSGGTHDGNVGSGGTVTIDGGTVTASGGSGTYYGAAMGSGGKYNTTLSVSGTVTIASNMSYGTSTTSIEAITTYIISAGEEMSDFSTDQYAEVQAMDLDWSITTQPADDTYIYGETIASLSVAVTQDTSDITYQWYSCDSDGSNATSIAAASNDTYLPTVSDVGTYYYYCAVSVTSGDITATVYSDIATVSITQATHDDATAAGSAMYGNSGSVSLSAWTGLDGYSFAIDEVTSGSDYLVADSYSISDDTLVFTFENVADNVDKTATINITVSSTNYKDFTITATLTVTSKITPTISVENFTKTYDTVAITIDDITVSVEDEVEGTWTFEDEATMTNVADTDTYTVMFTPDDTDTYVETSTEITVTIEAYEITFAVDDASAYKNASEPEYTYTQSGDLFDGDSWTIAPTIDSSAVDMTTNGTYTLTISADAGENYTITIETGTLTVTTKSNYTPSTSTTTTTTSATDTTTNDDGSVTATASASTTTSGTTVTVTVSDSNMETAIESAEEADEGEGVYVDIEVTTKSSTDTVVATFSTDAAEALVDSNVDALLITSDLGTMAISHDALDSIASQANDADITITVEYLNINDLTDAQKAVIGDRFAVNLTVTSGGEVISSFGGYEIIISIPYQLKDGESAENIVIWHVADDGTVTVMDTTYDEEAGLATFATTHFSVFAVMHDINAFTDVEPNDYYYNAVLWAVENGITTGYSDGTFRPTVSCTRAQAVTFLWRTAGEPVVNFINPFTDVSSDDYYYEAVLWAVSEGITAGTSDTTFSPNADCTRGQIVTFLYRAAGEPTVTGDCDFTDVSTDSYYYNAVLWAVENGITSGTTATTFSPSNDCTRGQIVTFLYRNLG